MKAAPHIVSNALSVAANLCEGGWTQHEAARDEHGEARSPLSTKATCWCATGAIRLALGPGAPERLEWAALTCLRQTLGVIGFRDAELGPHWETDDLVAVWNDNRARTQGQVVATLRIAADMAAQRQPERTATVVEREETRSSLVAVYFAVYARVAGKDAWYVERWGRGMAQADANAWKQHGTRPADAEDAS